MAKQRPSVDTRSYDAAETLLNTSDVFQALREDLQEDCIWELADRIQKAWEAYCEEQRF